MSTIYVVIGIRENVHQDRYDGPFIAHPSKEVVKAFTEEEDAINYIKKHRLSKPEKCSMSDTSYYQNGYYEMDYEQTELI